ncbi:MAG: bifunctional demethylmenaquinone methyltransferase/2-methoxy-6-polyprenyl-1,4-benzoquinol methylase UbiE [Phycisphaerales bacterium]
MSPSPTASTDLPPAWQKDELDANPHEHAQKQEKVRRMFASIAHAYDLNNRVHSFGRDQAWRRRTVKHSDLTPTDRVLDVACGTGDLALLYAKAGAGSVVGLDYTAEMLDIARARKAHPKIDYVRGDAQALPYEDGSFDVLSIAFGLRNVGNPDTALREFRRVLAPGGRLMVLEFSEPAFAPLRWGNDLYTKVIMPRTAALLARDRSGAYAYLPKSVETFLTREALLAAVERAGFAQVSQVSMTFGVCTLTKGVAPAP